MIYSVTGKPTIIDENTVAISNGMLSFEVIASTNTVYNLSRKTDTVTLLTYLYVREDEMRLFGFETLSEKSWSKGCNEYSFRHEFTKFGCCNFKWQC